MSLHDPAEGCGISSIWMLPSNCWAAPACKWHDDMFELHRAGILGMSRRLVDEIFYARLMGLAKTHSHRIQAYGLWLIARSVGWMYWK